MQRLPIAGYEGQYEIDRRGRVFSLQRTVVGKDGSTYSFEAKEIKPRLNPQNGYLQISLWKGNVASWRYIHRLVAETFIPNPENKPEVNHRNGFRWESYVDNLEWVTSAENSQHAIKTGLRVYTNRLTMSEFIDCLKSVISGESYAELSKRVPYKVPFLSTKLRAIAYDIGVLDLLEESLYQQKVRRARNNGAKAGR